MKQGGGAPAGVVRGKHASGADRRAGTMWSVSVENETCRLIHTREPLFSGVQDPRWRFHSSFQCWEAVWHGEGVKKEKK